MKSVSSDKEFLHVPRITQIDSKYLDNEVLGLLKETLSNAFAYSGQNILVRWEPELEAALKTYLYHFTLGKSSQTVGQQLLQIRYAKKNGSSKLKYCYLTLIFASWLKQRQHFFLSFISQKEIDLLTNIINKFEIVYVMLDVINLLVFLVKGKYPSLFERIFNLRVVPTSTDVRKISYAYFTRELLWNGFADLLTTILPLIPAKRFHTFICQFLPSVSSRQNVDPRDKGKNFETTCAFCNDLAILPHKFGCNHIACYYCIYSALSSGSCLCPLCSLKIEQLSQIIPLI